MGKYISLAVSNSVSKAEWVQAYEETLRFLKIFPLAERRKVNVKGIDTICLIPTAEKEEPAWWLGKNAKRIGWTASGDYETMQTADDISLFRDFVQGDLFDQEAGDAMLGAIADCMDYSWEDPRFQKVRPHGVGQHLANHITFIFWRSPAFLKQDWETRSSYTVT